MKRYYQMGSAMVEDLLGNAKWVMAKEAEDRIKELESEVELLNAKLDRRYEEEKEDNIKIAKYIKELSLKLKEAEDILRQYADERKITIDLNYLERTLMQITSQIKSIYAPTELQNQRTAILDFINLIRKHSELPIKPAQDYFKDKE